MGIWPGHAVPVGVAAAERIELVRHEAGCFSALAFNDQAALSIVGRVRVSHFDEAGGESH